MARRLLIFQWTGIAPREARPKDGVHNQVSCAAACYSVAEFMRLVGTRNRSWVSSYVNVDDHVGNDGARLASENPGVVYYHDTLRHAPRDAEWLVHAEPGLSA